MKLTFRARGRLAACAALACAVVVAPACALAAAPAALGGPAGRGAAVPAGFQPAAASFRSPASGVVLGGVACRGLVRGVWSRCAARLVGTADGGARWHFLTAPEVRLVGLLSTSRGAAVSSVVFASRRNGWLYGPGLWSTHDGGARWRRVSLGKAIVGMAAASGRVYAVARPAGYLSRGGPSELFASPAGRDAWARVRGVPASRAPASLAVSGRAAWFASGTHLRATADGVRWHRYPFRCPATYDLADITAASRAHVLFLCTGNGAAGSSDKVVLSSAHGGRAVHLAGRAPSGGGGAIIAVPPHRAKVITVAAESGASFLDRSADGGRTWTQMTVPGSGGGPLLSSLSYVSRTAGWVVLGEPGQGSQNRLLRTTDAGRTWHQASGATHPPRRQIAVTTLTSFKVVLTVTRSPGPGPAPLATVTAAGYRHAPGGWTLIARKRIGKASGWFWFPAEVCTLRVTQLKAEPSSAAESDKIKVSLLLTPALGCSKTYTRHWQP